MTRGGRLLTRGSSRLSVGSRIGRGRAHLDGETVGGGRGKAEGPRERGAVRVRLATGNALSAGRGREHAGIRKAERVAAAGAQPLAVRRSCARLGAPKSTAGKARIAGTGLSDARIADSELAADRTPHVDAGRQGVEKAHPVGRLALAVGGAAGRAGAALLAPEEVLAVRALRARRERRTATRARALIALRVARADGAGARARPAVPASAGAAAAHGACPAWGTTVRVARAEVRRGGRGDRARRQDHPRQGGSGGNDPGSVHTSIEAPPRPEDTAAGAGLSTSRRKLAFSRGFAPRRPAVRTVFGETSGVVPLASNA
jgi:hypothetical protein